MTLQERESHHYQRNDAYGTWSGPGSGCPTGYSPTSGPAASPRLRRGGEGQPAASCSAPSSTGSSRTATLARAWTAIDPTWDMSRAAMLGRQRGGHRAARHARPGQPGDGYFCTFAVARPFHALTDLHREYQRESEGLLGRCTSSNASTAHLAEPMMDSYWKTVDAIEDDPYVRMCEEADYVTVLHRPQRRAAPAAGPPVRIPRVAAVRRRRAGARVRRNVGLLVAALDHTNSTWTRTTTSSPASGWSRSCLRRLPGPRVLQVPRPQAGSRAEVDGRRVPSQARQGPPRQRRRLQPPPAHARRHSSKNKTVSGRRPGRSGVG